jgi:hypothetical protein
MSLYMVYRALRDVKEGEELCISYVEESEPKRERRKTLRENFYFDCSCHKCSTEEDGPDPPKEKEDTTAKPESKPMRACIE